MKIFNIKAEIPPESDLKPFWVLENVSEVNVQNIASRSSSLRYAVELWASGKSYDEFHANLKEYAKQMEENYKINPFKFQVEMYNKKIQQKEKIERIETMNYLPLHGKIDIHNPLNTFIYFEFYGIDPRNVYEVPEIFVGKKLFDGQRDLINQISLKKRKFIGNTSMDPQLSMLMANQGLCQENEIMFDPFCGTGSMLVSAALFGSYVIGSDIDYQMLHAKTKPSRIQQKVREKDESIKANLQQYKLEHLYLDVFVGDFCNCPLSDSLTFDSIITDPPYGNKYFILLILNYN
jgi:tRNA (guanine10-N2)-methyltransferase